MSRAIYILLLRLHPASFRQRFADEMLYIFDSSSPQWPLFADALASLVRQWLLRPQPAPIPAATAPVPTGGAPVFHTFEPEYPARTALAHGALLTVITFAAVAFAVARGSGAFPRTLIGSYYPRFDVLSFDRSSVSPAQPSTAVKVPSPAVDPLDELAKSYFKIITVLPAIDTDGDRVISRAELRNSRRTLRTADRNGDGRLSPEECGLDLGRIGNPGLSPEQAERMRRLFMSYHPVLAALDSDRNGEISTAEIKAAPAALRTLDQDHNEKLTPAEILPKRPASAPPARGTGTAAI